MFDYYNLRRIEDIARCMLKNPNLERQQEEKFLNAILECCNLLQRENRE